MKNKRLLLLYVFACLLLLPVGTALAESPAIHAVSIQADLLENGDAQLQEHWDVTVTSGTEWYLALNNMQGMEITGLSVQDEHGIPYTYMDTWELDRSIDEKANRCGIVDKGGDDYELCWGVGSYGRHQFTVSYTIAGFVKRYTDSAGFHHTFVSKGLSSPMDEAAVSIAYPARALNTAAANIWAFGYDGSIQFEDEYIVARTEGRMSTNEGIIILAELDPALFPRAKSSSAAFADVKERAFEGSDYGEDSGNVPIVFIVVAILFSLVVVGLAMYVILRSSLPDVYYRQEYGISRADLKKTAPATDALPFGGELSKTVALLGMFYELPSQVSVINYYMLKWLRENAITETTEQSGKKSVTTIRFNHSSYGEDRQESQLYGMLAAAAERGLLTQKAVEKWAYKKHSEINAWFKDYKVQATENLNMENITIQADVKRSVVSASIEVLNEKGWQCAKQVYGFKNYLLRCSQGQAGDIPEALLDEYLAYADIFRIYDQMEKWYEHHHLHNHYYGYYYMNRAFRTSFQAGESRHSGGGGSSSSGGGGGSSGGGGGGSR